MKYVPAGLLWITVAAMPVSFLAYAQDAQANGATAALSLTAESARILSEGNRIKREADLMRSEAIRLDSEADELQKGAVYLDHLWEKARKLDPDKYKDYAGRDKSQRRMRLDAAREKQDAVSLRIEGRKLDAEAVRLWKLAAAVDPQALKDLLDRLRNCCKLQTKLNIARACLRPIKIARSRPISLTLVGAFQGFALTANTAPRFALQVTHVSRLQGRRAAG